MKLKVIYSLAALGLLSAFCAQAVTQGSPTTRKRELIKQILMITEATKLAEVTSQAMLAQMEQQMPQMMQQILAQDSVSGGLTPQQRKDAESQLNQASTRMAQRMREELPRKINYAELVEQLSYSLYDKYFTEEELQDMITFYQSPTGKKTIKVMPQLAAESVQKSGELVMPKVMQLITDIVQDELKKLK